MRTSEMSDTDDYSARLYDEMRAIARRYMTRERSGHSLRPTELVHETFLRLHRAKNLDWNGRTHFLALAATQMRRILVEHARALSRRKRGGRPECVTIIDNLVATPNRLLDVLAVDQALSRLETKSPRQSQVVELRLFAGMQVAEMAAQLKVSERTIKKDWRIARAWLIRELGGAST